ncbi:MAG: M4 family metallopeptidase [Bacteroidales bacterium]|jgi:Zn-dependent metalloprotease|nr:M4 family metallopeptidase [Bacteroidales bacterium]
MKRFVIIFLALISAVTLPAQQKRGKEADKYIAGAEMVTLKKGMDFPVFIRLRADAALVSESDAILFTKKLLAIPNVDFQLKKQEKTAQGETLYRYIQTIAGYPVEFSAWNVLKRDAVQVMSGEISSQHIENVAFTLTEDAALQAALHYMNAEVYMWQDSSEEALLKQIQNSDRATYYPAGEKIIAPDSTSFIGTQLKTAYKFNIYAKKPHNRQMIYVNAQTGAILYARPLILFDNEIGTAHTQYSGIQTINTTSESNQYILLDNTRGAVIRTMDCHKVEGYDSATDFFDNDNIWNNINANLDQYATDAHFATMKTYDYYFIKHGRNSIDGEGFPLYSFIHYDVNYGNAFWNEQFMTYGDGASGETPYTSIDIAGHEITHGLTSMTANLYYEGESGALNEAFSDIFGTAIEHYAMPATANWTLGEDVGHVSRSLSDPNAYGYPATYHGLYWYNGTSDHGGVHINSSVLNHWFYLLCMGGDGINDLGTDALLLPSYITAAMPELNAEDVLLCSKEAFNIVLETSNDVNWYLPDSETPVHTGNTWNHPAVTDITTYHVREIFQGNTFHAGPVNNTTGGNFLGNPYYIYYQIFDAYTPFTLKSVSVNAYGSGTRSIALRDAAGTIITQRNVPVPNGVSRVQLDMDVPQGTNLQLVGLGQPNLFCTGISAMLNYPYTIPDVLSIKGSNAEGSATSYYYYFYDWAVQTPDCKSEILQAILMPTCTGITENNVTQNISAYPNPSSGLFTLQGLESGVSRQAILTNLAGQTLSAVTLTSNNIDLTNYPSGIYFLKEIKGAWVVKLVIND